MPENASYLKKARKWAKENGLHGPQAFLRYTMLNFVGAINKISEEFVFKGGNLLWVYIKTPRATVDLDFATKRIDTHAAIRKILNEACNDGGEGISYSIQSFFELEEDGKRGAEVTIAYRTDEGASNTFGLDIVYAISTDDVELPSPLQNKSAIKVATVENIIADKLSAANRFKAGNSRMKDFDDLWRLSKSTADVHRTRLARILKTRSIPDTLDSNWIGADMKRMWDNHRKRYEDLPESLQNLFSDVNSWLQKK